MKRHFIILAHCILNTSAKVKSNKDTSYESIGDLIKTLIDGDIGIIQLPCPETHCYGLQRWGHVKEQFDTPLYRRECRSLFSPCLDQIVNHLNAGHILIGIVGIKGSPSCGVSMTCSSTTWGGELGNHPDIRGALEDIEVIDESGIFMEEISQMLKEKKMKVDMLEYDRSAPDHFKRSLQKQIDTYAADIHEYIDS